MKTVDWERVWTVFEAAVAVPVEQRAEILDEKCQNDSILKEAVLGMLAADELDATFLDRPVLENGQANLLATGLMPDALSPERTETLPYASKLPKVKTREPSSIGPYRIERRVGQGGMSTTYLAVRADDAYRRQVVVKLVRQDKKSPDLIERLRAERQILAGLEHPNIARLYDGGTTEDGMPYFVMEYVEGVHIDAYCQEQALTVRERVALFRKVCAAVSYAHRNLVVHRDLKPSNILVKPDGEPKLLDFGIAKVLNPDAWSLELEPTATWSRVLTPSYASPEQIRGGTITTASDVYSLGLLLFQMLTGRLPYDLTGRSPAEIERLITESEPPRPSAVVAESGEVAGEDGLHPAGATSPEKLRKALAGDLDAIVLKALRSAPTKRYGTAEQLDVELARFQEGLPVEARRGTFRYRAGKFVLRHRAAVAAAATVILVLFATALILAYQASRITFERDQARLGRDEKSAVIALFEDLVTYAEPYSEGGSETTVKEVLTRGQPLLMSRLQEQPEVRAQLLHTSGSMLTRLGAYEDARLHLEDALSLRKDVLGENHPDVAATLRKLALVLKEQRDPNAEGLARRSVEILRPLGLPYEEELTASLTALSAVLCYRQAYDAAEEPVREALEMIRQARGSNAPELEMRNLSFLAAVHSRHGQYREAVVALRRSLALRRDLYGEAHPSRQRDLNHLALNLRWLGDFDAAEKINLEILEILRATHGTGHPDYARSLNNLAGVRFARGDYEGAAAAYFEARDLLLAAVGPDHWRVFFVDVNLDAVRIRTGRAAEAETNLRQGTARWRDRLGPDHWLLAQVESLIGEAAAAQGRDEEAERLLTRSLRKLIDVRAKDRYQRKALERLSLFLRERGRQSEIAEYKSLLDA